MNLSDADAAERVADHFAKRDYWAFMSHNAEAQVKALTWFRDESGGFPGGPGAATPAEWRERLDEMIDAWQAVLDIDRWEEVWSNEMIGAYRAECEERFRAGMAVYTKWYFHLWD